MPANGGPMITTPHKRAYRPESRQKCRSYTEYLQRYRDKNVAPTQNICNAIATKMSLLRRISATLSRQKCRSYTEYLQRYRDKNVAPTKRLVRLMLQILAGFALVALLAGYFGLFLLQHVQQLLFFFQQVFQKLLLFVGHLDQFFDAAEPFLQQFVAADNAFFHAFFDALTDQ